MKKYENDNMNYDENGYYSNDSENSGEKGVAAVFTKVMSVILLIWFFVSIILMIVIANSEREEKAWLIVVLFFQLFAVFGLFGLISDLITKGRIQKAMFVPLIIGAGGCIVSFVIHNSEGEQREKILKILEVCFPLIFTAAGIYKLFGSIRTKYHTKNICTELVTAKCVDISTISTTINGRTTYKYVPTYEYEYNDETYTSTAYKTPEHRIVGDNYEILVNPDKPKEIYDPASVDESTESMVLTALFFVILPTAISVIGACFLLIKP